MCRVIRGPFALPDYSRGPPVGEAAAPRYHAGHGGGGGGGAVGFVNLLHPRLSLGLAATPLPPGRPLVFPFMAGAGPILGFDQRGGVSPPPCLI